MRDVFYYGKKPNVHPKEQVATSLEDAKLKSKSEHFWIVNEFCDYTNFDWDFDFELLPDEEVWTKDHLNVWPDEYHKDSGTYLAPKNLGEFTIYRTDVEKIKIRNISFFDMFYIDRYNVDSEINYNKIKILYPKTIKSRFINNWVDTIQRCANKSTSKFFWVVSSELDYSNFKFNFFPDKWQTDYIHVFGTEWNRWSNTYLINKEIFEKQSKNIKIVEHLSNLNFVENPKVNLRKCYYDVYLIDFNTKDTERVKEVIVNKTQKYISVVNFTKNYVTTIKNIVKNIPYKKENYIWICSSICDYSNFDFSYISDPFAKDQLHVFPSDEQQYGDTFLVDVNKFKELNLSDLEEYEKINFNQSQQVKRLDCPIIITKETHCNIKYFDFDFPYAIFKTKDNENLTTTPETISLWDKSHKNILITNEGSSQIIIPKEAKDYVKNELYDYPYIITSNKLQKSNPLDIVFLSNGEKCADEHFFHLAEITKKLPNRLHRIDGIQGRVKSFYAAANKSLTPWAFIVFAKLKVSEKFDFSWQPDRLQKPKHYIFYAKNPVNGLIYGHQSMVAYNKNIVLNTIGNQLDFTMEGEHTVVELISGTAHFNNDELSTWRTAFRECIKLMDSKSQESKDRLEIWLTKAQGNYSEYSIYGSKDAVEYYNKVNGEFDKLKLTYEWNWLDEYFHKKYG
jgi:hypothetical protein